MPITSEQITKLDSERQQRIPLIRQNEAYVEGDNPNTKDAKPQKAPDNRIPIALAKIAVDRMSGFQGDIEVSWDNVNTPENEAEKPNEDEYIKARKEIFKHNETEIENIELRDNALTQGVAHELHWVSVGNNGDIVPEYTIVPDEEIVIVWSRDLKPVKEAVLRYQKHDKDYSCDVYYALYSEHWEKKEGAVEWSRNESLDTVYPYKTPPLACFPINKQQKSFFQAGKSLIDANDKMLNKSVNEVDRFNAMIALLPKKVDKEFVDKLRELNVMDDLGDEENWPQYMQKDLSGIEQFYSMVSKQTERWFFDVLSIVNMADENIQGIESGEALKRKMLAMEFAAKKIDLYFNKGIIERNMLINDVLSETTGLNPEDYQMTISIERNMPVDLTSKIDSLVKLFGTISKQTFLEALPRDIVPDVTKELERIKEEMTNSGIDLDDLTTDEE